MNKNKSIIILVSLILILLIINYSFIDKALKEFLIDYETGVVQRVIDGDTIIIYPEISVRLLGINSPERGELYHKEAKEFLENLILNKTIRLEFGKERYDKYDRVLAYIIIEDNINLELVKKGFANYYFPSGKDPYYSDFKEAWEECIESNKNLCEKSENKCAECIELKEFDWNNEIVVLYNRCNFDCELTGWEIRDEGRKSFVFKEFVLRSEKSVEIRVGEGIKNKTTLYWQGESYVWTRTGDTLFLRDDEGKLVLWRGY